MIRLSVKEMIWVLTDVNGVTINSTNYKINSGNGIDLCVLNASFSWSPLTDVNSSSVNQLTDSYSKRIGLTKYNGVQKKVFNLTCLIDDKNEVKSLGYKKINWSHLHDLMLFGHDVYLKDYVGSDSTVTRPIHYMMNETESIYYSLNSSQVYDSNGCRVKLTNIESASIDKDSGRAIVKLIFTESGDVT